MKLHSRLSRAVVDLVVRFETFHARSEPAAGGGWTIGYGHTRSARAGLQIGRQDAEALLLYDLAAAATTVEANLFAPVSQRQFEALTAFCFHVGAENFRSSSALARVNAGAELEAADEIERWRRAELGAGPQVVDALVRRRAAEKAHFLGLPEGCAKSPRALLRPLPGEDGLGWEPPAAAGGSASATLDAANSVQARLRELVPEPEPPPFMEEGPTPAAQASISPSPPLDLHPPPPAPAAFETPHEAPIEAAQPLASPDPVAGREIGANLDALPPPPPPPQAEAAAPAPFVAPPPPPPAHDVDVRAANDVTPPDGASRTAAAAPSRNTPREPSPTSREEGRRTWPILTARKVYAVLAVPGACLFVAAAGLILSGRPTLANLVLGVCSVGLMTPGVYGLLGPRGPQP